MFSKSAEKEATVYMHALSEHQKCCPENRTTAIRVYAGKNKYEIIKIQADEGRSDLNLKGYSVLKDACLEINEEEIIDSMGNSGGEMSAFVKFLPCFYDITPRRN